MIKIHAKVGDKIKITSGINDYLKPRCLDGLYKEGDILTIKSLSKHRLEYADGFHIKEVNEFATPKGIEALILPNEYEVLD